MVLKPIFQQLENMNVMILEIRHEQKSIASDLVNTKQEIKTLGQRQMEMTVPMLDKLTKKLFGNGTVGLLDEHVSCQEKIKSIQGQLDQIDGLKIWVRNLVFTLAGSAIAVIAAFSVMLFQVKELWRLIVK